MRSAASLYRRTLAVIIRAAESQIMAVEERRPAAGAGFGDGISGAAGGVGDIAQHTAANHAVILEIIAIVPFMGVAGKDGSHRRIGSLGFLVEGITVKDVDIIAAVNRIIVGIKGAALDGQLRAAAAVTAPP